MKKNSSDDIDPNEGRMYKSLRVNGIIVYTGLLGLVFILTYILSRASEQGMPNAGYGAPGVLLLCILAILMTALLLSLQYVWKRTVSKLLRQSRERLWKEKEANRNLLEKITHIAEHDFLTGLPNMQLFTDRIRQAILSARSSEQPFGIIFLDIDDFKMVNNMIGHEKGDELLVEVSRKLSGCVRRSDTVARYGEDEFVVLVQNLNRPDDINAVVEKLLGSFGRPFEMGGLDFHLTASVGVAMYPLDGECADMLMKNADIALFKAKETGKNQSVFSAPMITDKVTEKIRITNKLYHALERDELILYYQPQVSCLTGKIIGFEALLRWKQPELGLIPPDKFIPIAEQSGLIVPIGEWVLRTACIQNKKWKDAGFPPLRMSVNLSLVQVKSGDIEDQIHAILLETGMDPELLELEITESTAMNQDYHIVEILKRLKKLGITISIDDFGMEYSSLKRLKDMPIDRIKIAMPFVHGISVSDKDEAIAKTIITLAQSLGVCTIAEGVETKPQLDFLQERMCDEIQGFYFYRPLPAEKIEELLEKRGSQMTA